jgi:N-acetylglucosaminyldiphosphoundecaprenol N-acetyl-beta-D-mannosaminyltransferase
MSFIDHPLNYPSQVSILGVQVSAVSIPACLALMEDWIHNHSPHYICVTPAHSIMDCLSDARLCAIYNHSSLTTPDGMSLVWLLQAYGHKHVQRVYGPDLMLATCQYGVSRGWRHYFYGGAPGVSDRLAKALCARFTGLKVVGVESPPFRPLTLQEDQIIIEKMRTSGADIIWVGLGAPRQEFWMAEHVERIGRSILVGVGAAFDFLSGEKPQAPRWMQRAGFEWLFRFAHEPYRLWPRYRQYPRFAFLAITELINRKLC